MNPELLLKCQRCDFMVEIALSGNNLLELMLIQVKLKSSNHSMYICSVIARALKS